MGFNQDLVIERLLNAPLPLVWKALTDIEQLKKWLPFFPAFVAEVGFETRFKLGRDKNHLYEHVCKVLEVVDGKKLTYTWRYEGHAGDSNVTYELFDEGDKTKLVLTHHISEPFEDNPDFAPKNFAEGWDATADALKKFVES